MYIKIRERERYIYIWYRHFWEDEPFQRYSQKPYFRILFTGRVSWPVSSAWQDCFRESDCTVTAVSLSLTLVQFPEIHGFRAWKDLEDLTRKGSVYNFFGGSQWLCRWIGKTMAGATKPSKDGMKQQNELPEGSNCHFKMFQALLKTNKNNES